MHVPSVSVVQELKAPPSLLQADGTTVRPTHFEPDSFFGMYIRQLVLEFHNVVFEGMSNLVDDLHAWLAGEEDDEEDAWYERPEGVPKKSMCGTSTRMAQVYVQVGESSFPPVHFSGCRCHPPISLNT
jgi:hypothetical protein